jgi:undecaprenyl-diphosphatase
MTTHDRRRGRARSAGPTRIGERRTGERRATERSHFHLAADVLYGLLRSIAGHAKSFYAALGIYIVAGAAVAIAGTWGFAALAEHIAEGGTWALDRAVLQWMGAHRVQWIEHSLLEITALGTGLVVMTMVVISALFLVLTEHRYSAILLVVANAGGIVLNNVLKQAYDRPRPRVFEWVTQPYGGSSSFPSGHAMSAAIVYATVAYLATRLQKHAWQRVLTWLVAAAVIALICISRLYLGVHYPSDVLGGTIIGLAWAAFCMAGLEAVRVFAKRYRPRELEHERDLDPKERQAAGLST